jgi:hypothetical protein
MLDLNVLLFGKEKLKVKTNSFFELDTGAAGRFTLWCGNKLGFHIFPGTAHRFWGLHRDWYDAPHWNLGFGRLLLICYSPWG